MIAVLAASAAVITGDSRPKWLRFEPEMHLSKEGFRDVKWCTRIGGFPWKPSRLSFPASGVLRQDEDYDVFGVRAKWITYTLRNSIFYGVRIDIEGRADIEKAAAQVRREYPPVGEIETINDLERRWSTDSTSVWITLPQDKAGRGTIYLWGRDRKFHDDSKTPYFLAKPPDINSDPRPYQPRYYVIYRASGPITIDGDLSEKAWQDAGWLDAFVDHQHPYAPAPWKTTRAALLYDDEYIYAAAQMQEENVWGHLTERNSIIYYDNDIEIFLDPSADGMNYFEFELNPLNTMFDMWHELDNHRGAYANPVVFNSEGTRHAVKVDGTLNYHHDIDNGWTVEVKIPLADLKPWNPDMTVPIRRGDLWRINFSRVQYMHVYTQLFPYLLPYSPCEDWVLAPTDTGDLHIPELWAKAVFSDLYAGQYDTELEEARPGVLPIPRPQPRIEGMVYFPAVRMTVGPDPKDPVHSPAHDVDVPAFWLDRYPVTVAEYTAFLNLGGNDEYYSPWMRIPERCGIIHEGPGRYRVVPGREDYPVTYVSHQAATAYAAAQNKILPTEFMWERAARGAEGRVFPWGNDPIDPTRANYDFHYGGTTPVGCFPKGATPEGVFDLIGNVKEWTSSEFRPYPGGEPFAHRWLPFWFDPVPENPEYWPVDRGGGWTKQESNMAASYRDGQASMNTGFRCARLGDSQD
jgi:formylglycine-generating enzyme required for sulfatase activity